ncbi:MAG: type II toxin-antitoxin system VapC family toxin [Cyanobacteria bacterium P01_D01_bin.123]
MLVIDTNIISYLYFPTAYTQYSEALLKLDSSWAAPILWRSEFRNILALYLRKEVIDLAVAMDIQAQAEMLMARNEFEMNSSKVLILAQSSGCSAYDCEFISLAQTFNMRLITTDKKLIKAFPKRAISAKAYVEENC